MSSIAVQNNFNGDKFRHLLDEIEMWWRINDPKFYATLNPGLPVEELSHAESVFGFPLPQELKMLYSLHNGQHRKSFADRAALPGITSMIWPGDWMPMARVIEEWTLKNEIFGRDDDFSHLPPEFGGKLNWWNRRWIPFIDIVGLDLLCLDTLGSFGGKPGQIIQFIHNENCREIRYPNLYMWLLTTLRLLQAPNMLDEEGDFDIWRPEVKKITKELNPGYPWYFPPDE